MRKTGRLMRRSCYGPCVVFKDEALAPRWGAYEGWSNLTLLLAMTVDGSHIAGREASIGKFSPLLSVASFVGVFFLQRQAASCIGATAAAVSF
jgi:hypothetical protein